jgi:hypothetical protein
MLIRRLPPTPSSGFLTVGQTYVVVGFDDEVFRVINDFGEPILYSRDGFEVLDERSPDDWVRNTVASDEYYVDPPETAMPGFYEDYFDGDPAARETFARVVARTFAWHGLEPPELAEFGAVRPARE